MEKRPALGKGLSALIPDAPEPPRGGAIEIDVDRLSPNALQPRGQFDEARLDDLARSIKATGIIQPIVVRKVGDRFQIIAGERRWRAAQLAGLARVPVIVKDVAAGQERAILEMALIENIQRENLNPIDEALAYRRLTDDFHLTQDAIADAVGKDRATVANVLRLLKLPLDVRADVASGNLSMGHARALLTLANERDQLRVARDVIARRLSVRETEALVKKLVEEDGSREKKPGKPADIHTRAAEDRLKVALGTEVRIRRRGSRGRIEVDFGSEAELIRLYEQLTGER
jgi:ParB family transcriptional regulator, chromosome partitioning protein